MQKDNSTNMSVLRENKNTYKAPMLFSIPPNVYCEEIKKERDRSWYLKIQKLQKDSQLLRAELSDLARRKEEMVQITHSLVAESRAVKNNFDQKKAELNETVKLIKTLNVAM